MRPLLPAFLAAVIISSCSQARMAAPIPNWHNLDLEKDGVFGISTEKAYAQLLRGKKARMTIVAVIDSGIDTAQEDLRPVLWTDPADGSHGRNYIGSETGKEDFIPVLETQKGDPGYRKTLDDYHVHVKRLESFITS